MTTVLVTGGSGFTGSHLVRDLLSDGHEVRVISRSRERAREVLPAAVEIIEGRVEDRETVRRATRGAEVIYHLATSFREAGIPDRQHWEVHVDGTRLLLEAAKAEGATRFVHCSTIGVHSHIEHPPADEEYPHQPGDIYQLTKSEGERLAIAFHERHGLPLTVARPATIYGPGDTRFLKLFRAVSRRRFVMLGKGTVFIHPVYIRDLVRGFRLLGEHPAAVGQAFIIGGREYLTLNDFVALIAAVVGTRRPRWHLPVRPIQWLGSACEAVCVPLRIEPPVYRRRVDFFTKSRAFSIAKAERLLGYHPHVELRDGLRVTAAWYRARGWLPPVSPELALA